MGPFRANVELLRPKWSFVGGGAFGFAMVLPALALVLRSPVPGSSFPMLVIGPLFGAMSLRYGFMSTARARRRPGTIELDGEHIRFGGATVARRSDVVHGSLVPTEEGTLVRLDRRRSWPIFLRVADERTGAALVEALGLDASRTAAEMRIASSMLAMSITRQIALVVVPLFAFVLAALLTSATLREQAAPFVGWAVVLLLAYILTLSFAPTTVRVGTDGVLTRWLGRERFFAFGTIASAGVYDELIGNKRQHGVRLTLKDGTVARLATGQTDTGAADARRLHRRILEANEARRRGTAAPTTSLERGDRRVLDWVRDLRRLGAGAHDPRSPAIPPEVLLRVVEDATAPAAERVAAAVAIATTGNAEARGRIRVAAEMSASPAVRVALVRVAQLDADATDEAVASTLEELTGDGGRRATGAHAAGGR